VAPAAGEVEKYASWRAAWRALGRPEADREELELSDGQLRVRIRAYEREEKWGPRYVANEMAGTQQAAARHRHTAAIRAAEAEAATDPTARTRLALEADNATEMAAVLEARAADLEVADAARAQWYAHTAETRGS
jgi:hypothetical protein